MNFQQLKAVRETARCRFNLQLVADTLFISQPGVSHQIRDLEEELGVQIFERNGKRLVGPTDAGKDILEIVERLLVQAENLRQAASNYSSEQRGTLTIATTHTQARYGLPEVVQSFRASFPDVRVALRQGSPEDIAQSVISGKANIGIATEGFDAFRELVTFPCYSRHHVLVAPAGHPLLSLRRKPTLDDIAPYPLVTYDVGFSGRSHIDNAFAAAGLKPDVVLSAMDSDVIRQYVALGLGVGIVAAMALEDHGFRSLQSIDVSHLFAENITRLVVRRGAQLRAYVHAFMLRFSPSLSREEIERAVLDPSRLTDL